MNQPLAFYPLPPATEAMRKARLIADFEELLDRHGYEATSRALALLLVETVSDAEDEMEREER